MNRIVLDKQIYNKCNNAIIVTGSARSGTTIMGKIIHSFQNVEYAYEPPMLFSLFPLINILDENNWKLLYETYLYEDFLMAALSGRGLNCNLVDDSSIYKVKPQHLIKERLNKSLRKIDGERLAEKSQIAIKMPDVVPFLPKLKTYYPGTSVVIILRKAPYVFNSLLEKGWFNDRTLQEQNLIWPNRFIDGFRIPFWVESNEEESWCQMDELHRVAYYYIRMNQHVNNIPGCITIKYDRLIRSPRQTAMTLADSLNLSFGGKTEDILSTIKYTKKERDLNILATLKPDIRDQVEYYTRIS